jgi:outer membrane protein assembly factor BamD
MAWIAGVLGWAMLVSCAGNVPDRDAAAHERNITKTHPAQTKSTQKMDEAYVAYRTTHENSLKIPGMILDLIHEHIKKGEYQLARFYCDEYRQGFPSGNDRAKVEFLRAKALFLRTTWQQDERLEEQAFSEAKLFLSGYPRSIYRSQMEALVLRLKLQRNARYERLAQFYEKRGKPKAAQIYREKIEK